MATLQEMIEALALNLPNVALPDEQHIMPETNQAISGAQDTSPGHEKRPLTLTDLPAELRDRIYELALYHHENAGVVSLPATTPHAATRKLSIAGLWQDVVCPAPSALQGADPTTFLQQAIAAKLLTQAEVDRYSNVNDVRLRDARLANLILMAKKRSRGRGWHPMFLFYDSNGIMHLPTGHICIYQCLLQPSLTRVNRAVREEALSVFYSCNAFEIRSLQANIEQAVRWWRGVGDSNLRSMNSLLLCLKPSVELHFQTTEYDGLRVRLEVRKQDGSAFKVLLVEGKVQLWIGSPGMTAAGDRARRRGAGTVDDHSDQDTDEDSGAENSTVIVGTNREDIGTIAGNENGEQNTYPTARELSRAKDFNPHIVAAYVRIVEPFVEGGLCVQTIEQAMADLIDGWSIHGRQARVVRSFHG
ncbi:hypothetical protein LTR78_005831 [Recurvomyces mirabilis]|uniref:Uncharacterized protein n=1 Tax=Recurvomyces mirabilis TaxID=574656 RepID=A0AAE0WME2_9PEZI|nr:hypothetical protein LTR78_005831 [Recurvomyces mirabilis]KAK5154211.1 hypothetical protein LTS14_006896 [Recurvomyces mirabilis]